MLLENEYNIFLKFKMQCTVAYAARVSIKHVYILSKISNKIRMLHKKISMDSTCNGMQKSRNTYDWLEQLPFAALNTLIAWSADYRTVEILANMIFSSWRFHSTPSFCRKEETKIWYIPKLIDWDDRIHFSS